MKNGSGRLYIPSKTRVRSWNLWLLSSMRRLISFAILFCMRLCLYLPMSVLLVPHLCVACACAGGRNSNYEYLFELDCAASRRCACVVRVVKIRIQEIEGMLKANLGQIRGFFRLLTCLVIRHVIAERWHYIHKGCELVQFGIFNVYINHFLFWLGAWPREQVCYV